MTVETTAPYDSGGQFIYPPDTGLSPLRHPYLAGRPRTFGRLPAVQRRRSRHRPTRRTGAEGTPQRRRGTGAPVGRLVAAAGRSVAAGPSDRSPHTKSGARHGTAGRDKPLDRTAEVRSNAQP
jgi:hypothetical protein